MKHANPFVVKGYRSPEYFCDRERETKALVSALENDRNGTLLAPRRYGKTGLIRNAFHRFPEDWTAVYADVYSTANLREFTQTLANAVVGSLDTAAEKALAAVGRFFQSVRPTLTQDGTGGVTVSFSVDSRNTEATLKGVFDYIASKDRRIVVAIDEFQQILTYPEKGTEALLRSYVQFLPNARFIFAGSRHHMMTEMFSSAKRPFFHSTQTLPLERIDPDVYFEFARRKMSAVSDLTREAFDRAYGLFDGITWYVQAVLNRMYERKSSSAGDVGPIVEDLLREKTWEYDALLKSLPAGSARLLKAVAATGRARAVTGAGFMAAHSLRGASSVSLSLKKLLEDELLYETEDGYVVYDRLFGLWLSRLPRQ